MITYHYTRIDSLLGILNECNSENPNLCLWASHYQYANDPEEKKIGRDMLYQYLGEVENEMGISENQQISKMLNEGLFKDFEEVHKKMKCSHITNTSSYYLSFSLSEDSLPMWRMYGNNGTGISLGFNVEKLAKFFKETRNTDLGKCWYNVDSNIHNWKKLIKEIYQECLVINERHRKSMLEKMSKVKNVDLAEKDLIRINGMTNLIFLEEAITSSFKNPAYQYEQELKVVFDDVGQEVYYRASKDFILPYLKIYIPVGILDKIIIGPTLNYDLTRLSILKFLDSKTIPYNSIEISQSKIPYRI